MNRVCLFVCLDGGMSYRLGLVIKPRFIICLCLNI